MEAILVVCHHFCLVWTDLHFVPCADSIKTVYQDASLYFLFAFTTMSSAKRKLVMSRPPMLTQPSWSSKASHMILSRKMLKRVGESIHPCRTPTVVLNHSPVLPLNRTALWALSYRFSMARMMLALMLYFLIVAHKPSCHTLSKAFLKSMKSWLIFCWCCRYFSQRILRLNICTFPFGFEGRMLDLIVSVPDHCLSFYFVLWCSFRLWNLLALLQWSLLHVAGVCLGLSSAWPY